MSGDDGGDCFLVERYESDIEEEGGASASSHTPKKAVKGEKQLMLVISERFLEEKSSMGDKVKQILCTYTWCLPGPFLVNIEGLSRLGTSYFLLNLLLHVHVCSLWINGT
jgi:hypothetical protein